MFDDDFIPFASPPPLNETRSGWARRDVPNNAWKTGIKNEFEVGAGLRKRADKYMKQKYALRDIGILSLPSRVPLAEDDGFDYASEAGKGITVYIIDTGVNTAHPVRRLIFKLHRS